MSDQELEVQVESEANQYIPFFEEVSLDFCVIGPNKNSPGDVDVLIAASRREKVQDREGLAEAAGLKAVIVDIESNAARLAAGRVIRLLPNQGKDAVVALFEIGALTTSMQVMRNDEVLYDRDQAFGGSQLTQLIVRQYGFSAEEAEAKKRNGELPEDYASTVLRPFVESTAQEIGRALQFFYQHSLQPGRSHSAGRRISCSLPGLTRLLSQHTGFACITVNPFDGMEIGNGVRLKKNGARGTVLPHFVRFGHAEVSAVILINLLPHREAARKRRREMFQATMFAFLVGVLIAGGIYTCFNQ